MSAEFPPADVRSAEPTLPVRVITPHAGLEGFRYARRSLTSGAASAFQLAWRFFLRDTRAAHRQSLLGYAWLAASPLANTLVWVFLNQSDVVQIDSGGVPYPVFVLCGTILWGAFNGSLMALLGVINEARGMLAKVNFPHEALVYAALLKASVDAGIPSLLLLPALLLFSVPVHATMLLFPVALLGCLLLGAALGLIVLPLAALYQDIGRGIQLALRFGFFFTPVIFMLPASGVARQVMLLNPVTPFVVSGRAWLTGSGEAMPLAFLALTAGCLVLTALGLVLLKVTLPHLIERLSS